MSDLIMQEAKTMDTTTRITRASALADLIERQTEERFVREGYNPELHRVQAITTHVRPGKKYIKVDVGTSGRYMIDEAGDIYGIKAYGVIHRGHHYGNLDTINQWYWGDYTAKRVS